MRTMRRNPMRTMRINAYEEKSDAIRDVSDVSNRGKRWSEQRERKRERKRERENVI